MYTVPFNMGVIMSKMVKLYDEIFKLIPLIDAKWDEIMNRKDNQIEVGSYVIRKEKAKWDDNHEYWMVSIDKPVAYSNRFNNVICFYERGCSSIDEFPCNISTYDSLVLSKYNDTIMFSKEDRFGSEEEYTCTIPYDRTASVEERKFSVDVSFEREGEREIMKRMIDFQNMDLKHIDLISYSFDLFVVLSDGFVYNELSSRPFFKTGESK